MPSETARAAHCIHRCKSLMNLKHPEMLELSVKRFSVLSTERDGRQCGCQEAYTVFTYEPLQNRTCMLNSTWRLCHRSQQQHVNTRFGCRHTTRYSSGIALEPTVWGRRVKYGWTPYFNIGLAAANQICTFFHSKSHDYYKKNRIFVKIVI